MRIMTAGCRSRWTAAGIRQVPVEVEPVSEGDEGPGEDGTEVPDRRRQEDQRQKRFIVTDTLGLLMVVVVLAASVQDRDGAKTTLISAVPDQPDPVRPRRRQEALTKNSFT
jgi:hypothetical protein